MKKIRKHHKRHFQLLELMVAMFILLVCVVPTMRIFTSMYLSQQDMIRENQRDHLAHMAHAQITEMLYKRQISLEGIDNQIIRLPDSELNDLLAKFSYALEGKLLLADSYTPRGKEKPTMYLGLLIIKLTDVSPKAQDKKLKNGEKDPNESFYDYYMYIDVGQMKKEEKKSKEKIQSDQESIDDEEETSSSLISEPLDSKKE